MGCYSEGRPRTVGNEIVEYELQLKANLGRGVDRYFILKSLSNWHRIVNNVKTGKVYFL